mgnify:CR=1 FL=1
MNERCKRCGWPFGARWHECPEGPAWGAATVKFFDTMLADEVDDVLAAAGFSTRYVLKVARNLRSVTKDGRGDELLAALRTLRGVEWAEPLMLERIGPRGEGGGR